MPDATYPGDIQQLNSTKEWFTHAALFFSRRPVDRDFPSLFPLLLMLLLQNVSPSSV
jgi:hypothetical protein